MKVRYVGFGGGFAEYPCYEDENGKLYFDLNDGRGDLYLHTGAYRDECDEICGEPYAAVKVSVECDNPFKRHPRERDYMMLGRWKSDCDYYLGCGNRSERYLYHKDVATHISEMKKLWDSFADADKPEWLTMEQIENYRKEMTA